MVVNHILFPTDFSEAAERALPHVLEMSKRFSARITVLHVRAPYGDDPARPEFRLLDERKYEVHLEDRLKEMSVGMASEDRVDTAMVKDISPASGILEFAQEHSIDLIAMGTHGRSGLSRFLLGSVAEKVVRHAQCPVLTVASNRTEYRDKPVYRRVLIAFDFSDISSEAVRRGCEFAGTYGAQVDVLYVLEQSVFPPFDTTWKNTAKGELPSVAESAKKALSGILEDSGGLESINLQVQVGDADGKAETEIVAYARDSGIDLIIVGTHGLSGLNHALLGSTTERVVRMAACPVLTFHHRGS